MTPLIFDLIIIGAVLLSVALGYLRGFVNEVFTIFGWIAAIIATIYFTPVLRDYGRNFIEKRWLADLATSSAIFLGTLGICSVVSYFATRTIHATKLGFIDRTLGFCFGAVRAIVLLGMAYALFSNFYSEENTPAFIAEAKSRPFLEASAGWVKVVLPLDDAVEAAEDSKVTEKVKETAQDVAKDLKSSKHEEDKPITREDILKKFDVHNLPLGQPDTPPETPKDETKKSEKKDD